MSELVDVQVRVPAAMKARIELLADQCGLTGDQMASAMFVLAAQNMHAVDEPEETHL